MKKLLLVLFVFVGISAHAQGLSFYKNLFWKQMASTCQGEITWEKAVSDPQIDHPKVVQARLYKIDCQRGLVRCDGQVDNLPWEEFSYLFQYDFENPYLAPLLEVQQTDSGLTVRPKADESSAALQFLHFKIKNGLLSHAEVDVKKHNTLYELSVHTIVKFDEAGHYISHETRTFTDVMLGSAVQTLIQGTIWK